MSRNNKPFITQLVIVGGFLIFIYIFFALATSIYRDYKLQVNIEKFESEIDHLAKMANQKPKDVLYYKSDEYKDKYAKESLNLLNPGEKVIIIPSDDVVITQEEISSHIKNPDILQLPYKNQWWEYFFGNTLSIKTNQKNTTDIKNRILPNQNQDVNSESLIEVEG